MQKAGVCFCANLGRKSNGLNQAVAQGKELAEDLLAFSQVGERSGPIETTDIGVFLEELIASLALSPDVEVVMGNDWPTIDTDPTLLMQVFQNLIKNAILGKGSTFFVALPKTQGER